VTDGEKMIWAAVFGHTYTANVSMFQIDMYSTCAREDQEDEHRIQRATLAAEAATRAVEAARRIRSCDIDNDTAKMMGAVFECD
jgi:hypothetical protein